MQLAFVLVVGVIYASAIVYMGGLSFDPIKDEQQFWEEVLFFTRVWPPTIEQVRSYPEPMTPLAFLLWAALEAWHQLGIGAARLVNVCASLAVLAVIGLSRPAPGAERTAPILAALTLLLYPYWLPISLLLYTDVLAAAFVVFGFWFYVRERHVASAVLFVLAISTRQYMVTFPAAIVGYELLVALRSRSPAWSRWVPHAAACVSLIAWFVFFGGMGPAAGLEKWPRHTGALAAIEPAFSLYFLASMGAYFVVPEFMFYRRWRDFGFRFDRRTAVSLAAVLVGFLIFTPNYPVRMGALNRSLNFVLGESGLGEALRVAVLFGLTCATALRFPRLDLGTWLVAVNGGLMCFLWSPWEKYCMPLLAALWFLKVAGALDEPAAATTPASA